MGPHEDNERPLVLHVIHRLATGGLENGLVNLVNGMRDSRFRHAIACIEDVSDFRQRLARPDVELVALERSRVGVWRMRRDIHALCRRLRPAILHTRNLSGLDALLPARIAGVRRCLHGEHGWDVDDLRGDKLRPAILRRLHVPLIDHYVTVSKDLERYLIRRVGIARSRITAICNGVDVERFAPAIEKPMQLLPLDWRAASTFIVGTVGRLQVVKDQAVLVRAFAQLLADRPALRPRLRLAVVGEGPLLEELNQLARSLGIADFVWLPGGIDNVPDVLRLFDLFVLPSLNEGISNTILEALASAVPVVATRVGGNVEVVKDGRYGRLFPPGDVDALAGLIGEYVDDPALRSAHAAAARHAAVARFSLAGMISGYSELYESLMSPVSPATGSDIPIAADYPPSTQSADRHRVPSDAAEIGRAKNRYVGRLRS
jgi:sugar transferase (PEP-CTERM/EpsH1 system associated)